LDDARFTSALQLTLAKPTALAQPKKPFGHT